MPEDTDTDEVADVEPDEELQQTFQQAQQVHARLDEFKNWAVDEAGEIRTRADVLEEVDEISPEEAAQRRQVADVVRSIYERIEMGDSNRAKQTAVPSDGDAE